MKTGVELIAEERDRQIENKKWSPSHDDEHKSMVLAVAGVSYVLDCAGREYGGHPGIKGYYRQTGSEIWPFDNEWFKPTPEDPIRQLQKAGALIAAELDKLQRVKFDNPNQTKLELDEKK